MPLSIALSFPHHCHDSLHELGAEQRTQMQERSEEMREWGESKEEVFSARSFEPKGQNMRENNMRNKV